MDQSINWTNLIEAVKSDQCILVLGPNIAKVRKTGIQTSLHELLTQTLAEKLKQRAPGISLVKDYNLSYVARKLEDAILPDVNFSSEKARAYIGQQIKDFYSAYKHQDFPIFQQLAKLPFRFIVNTNPDNFLSEAYDDENKFAAVTEFYHYRNPVHNNNVYIEGQEISEDAPLIYNLFGSIQSPDSLILTEADRLAFLDAILQREKTATIPPSIAIHFTSSEQKRINKNFVFLGFDFNQWHLKLIMHLINRFQKQKETIALQDPKSLTEITSFFYERNFEVQFVNLNPADFTKHFEQHLRIKAKQPTAAPKLKVFLMYDSNDEEEKSKLNQQLASLQRSDMIETWDEAKILPGVEAENEIQHQLTTADIILLLITPRFFASDKIYEQQLRIALDRHQRKKTVVIPILMKSCHWNNSLIGNLTTILPRNKTPLNEQANEAASLSDTVRQLEKFCEKIYQRKNQS